MHVKMETCAARGERAREYWTSDSDLFFRRVADSRGEENLGGGAMVRR